MKKRILLATILSLLILASSVNAICINKTELKDKQLLKNSKIYEENVGYMSISPGTLENLWEDYQINVELNPDFGGEDKKFSIQHNSELIITAEYEILYDSLVLLEEWKFTLYLYGYVNDSRVESFYDCVIINDFDQFDGDDKVKGNLEITISWDDFDQIVAVLDASYWRLPWDSSQIISKETDFIDINILENIAPTTPTIRGAESGLVNKDYQYTIFSEDTEGDNIYYYIEWGDNKYVDWIGPYESGEIITFTHNWSKKGDYDIKVKAKDDFDGAESNWGLLSVQMPKTKIVLLDIFARILNNFAFIQKFLKL